MNPKSFKKQMTALWLQINSAYKMWWIYIAKLPLSEVAILIEWSFDFICRFNKLYSTVFLNRIHTWVHFDKRYGTPACSAGFPVLRSGSRGVYVLILQDALNALGYSTQTLDGVFGGNTRSALVAYQRDNGLSADGVVGCGTWTRIVNEVVGIGRTPTVIDP